MVTHMMQTELRLSSQKRLQITAWSTIGDLDIHCVTFSMISSV